MRRYFAAVGDGAFLSGLDIAQHGHRYITLRANSLRNRFKRRSAFDAQTDSSTNDPPPAPSVSPDSTFLPKSCKQKEGEEAYLIGIIFRIRQSPANMYHTAEAPVSWRLPGSGPAALHQIDKASKGLYAGRSRLFVNKEGQHRNAVFLPGRASSSSPLFRCRKKVLPRCNPAWHSGSTPTLFCPWPPIFWLSRAWPGNGCSYHLRRKDIMGIAVR